MNRNKYHSSFINKIKPKKIIEFFLFFFILLLIINPKAQAQKSNLSLVVAYNTSFLQVEDTGASNSFYGRTTKTYGDFGYGALIEYPLQAKWGLESGLIFLPRGYKYDTSYPSPDTENVHWMNFYIPIVGRFHPTKNFTGFIGAYTSLGFGNVSQYSTSDPKNISETTFKQSGLKTTDYGITYGAGLNFDVSSSLEMLVEIRWTEGLTNVIDTSTSQGSDNTKGTIHEYSVVVGFKI